MKSSFENKSVNNEWIWTVENMKKKSLTSLMGKKQMSIESVTIYKVSYEPLDWCIRNAKHKSDSDHTQKLST